MWRYLVLGAADKPVTEQQFTELENRIYEQMQGVQDIARNIQGDQISSLNNTITIFLTLAGLVISVVAIFAGVLFSRIKKANEKAAEEMRKASVMMAAAQELTDAANKKAEYLEDRQVELKELIESKQLNEKMQDVERLVQAHSKMLLQDQIRSTLELTSDYLERAKPCIALSDTDGEEIRGEATKIRRDLGILENDILHLKQETFLLIRNPEIDGDKLLNKATVAYAEAIEVESKAYQFHSTYRRFPSVTPKDQ